MTHYFLASKETPSAKSLFERLEKAAEDSTIIWSFLKTPKELDQKLKVTNPDTLIKIFFFHWGWIVPKDIHEVYSCVVIHTSNLPEGRGGSPLQNQIVDKIWKTRVNAIKMTGELDAGGIYDSEEISLQGDINDIWNTVMLATEKIIRRMILKPYIGPQPQMGHISKYKRRKPSQSSLPTDNSSDLRNLYDHIRMLDGIGYPIAFLDHGPYRLTFSRAKYNPDSQEILADVRIKFRS